MGRPILVTGHSEVLKGHCERSGAGLWFDDYEQFACRLGKLLADDEAYRLMRERAVQYVEENYRWDVVIEKYRTLIENMIQRR